MKPAELAYHYVTRPSRDPRTYLAGMNHHDIEEFWRAVWTLRDTTRREGAHEATP